MKDVDFEYRQITVRDGKGGKDRATMLPGELAEPLRSHLARVKSLHEHDLAEGYGTVELPFALERKYPNASRRLNEQVRRNAGRFPPEFVIALTNQEVADLKSQIATSSWGGKRKLPLVFTEHGAVMAATVLNSRKAVEMSVFVVRAFIQMRDALGRPSGNRETLGRPGRIGFVQD